MSEQTPLAVGMVFTRVEPHDGIHRIFLRDTTIGFPYTIYSLEDGQVYIMDDENDSVCMSQTGFYNAFTPRVIFRPVEQVAFEQDTTQTLQLLVKRIADLTQTVQELKDYIQGTKK